ncbi:hypothetical protein UT300005_20180 [Clostridium sp. CTA-5]
MIINLEIKRSYFKANLIIGGLNRKIAFIYDRDNYIIYKLIIYEGNVYYEEINHYSNI